MWFYGFSSLILFFALLVFFSPVFIMFPEKKKFRIIKGAISVVVVIAIMPMSQGFASWRIESSLERLFQENLRYTVNDYRRTVIDDVRVYAAGASNLGFAYAGGPDACVEARINLPEGLRMTGFRWYSQNYYYDESEGSLLDAFNASQFWTSSIFVEGRCVRPSFS